MISTRYARAIYEYAAEKENETPLYRDMQVLTKNFGEYPVLRKGLNDPTVSSEQKINLLVTACGIQTGDTSKQMIRMIVENGRAGSMENIALRYEEIYRKEKGIVIVRLTTVEPASEKTKETLSRLISKNAEEQIEFHTEINPDIVGGFILEIEDKRLDASVKEQLRVISYNL
jgi:F-type H+-transporting ATPase subunit delta